MFNQRTGVTTPANQGMPTGEGPANTVVNAIPCSFVAVEYFDDNGRRKHDVFMRAGDTYYQPPNSEEWARALRPVRAWLADGIKAKTTVADEVIPAHDSVNIFVKPSEAAQ